MIEFNQEHLKSGIRECWKRCFTTSDQRYTDYFFRYIYKDAYGYAKTIDKHVISSVCRIPMDYMFNGRVLKASMLTGLCTLPEERNGRHEEDVMEVVMDACSRSELLTFVNTRKPELFYQYGFESVYKRSVYALSRENMKRMNNYGCAYEVSPIDMLKVYSYYIRNFNGFLARDLDYFVNYKKEVAARGGKIVAFYDGKDQIRGYAAIMIEGRVARIEEIVYLDSVSLMKLLNAALMERAEVFLHVSESENLSKVFPSVKRVDYEDVMVRLNDKELFSRLFKTPVETVQEAFAISKKPINLNEHYMQ